MFGAISLTSVQVGATVTEGDISGGAGFDQRRRSQGDRQSENGRRQI